MTRTAKKATKVIPISRQPKKPYSGFVVHTAHSDGPGWFSASIFRQIDHDHGVYSDPADPLVTIELDRRNAPVVGDPRPSGTEVIENIRASDVDLLIAQLADVLAAARATGMLPPRISNEDYGAHVDARRAAIAERDKAKAK
jgi:predicted O-linked N-acetylglucosamine transferase (SPINDLY family)